MIQSTTCIFSRQQPQDFNTKLSECVIYVEADNKILTFPNESKRWDLPIDALLTQEIPIEAALRILRKQANLVPEKGTLASHGISYTRVLEIDTTLHFFRLTLNQIPDHLARASWVSIFAYRYLYLIRGNGLDLDAFPPEDGRIEAFNAVYHDRIWHPISTPEKTSSSSTTVHQVGILILQKGKEQIKFSSQKRLIIPLLGIAASGKRTQSLLLQQALRIPSTSTREAYASNESIKELMGLFIKTHPDQSPPEDIAIGMIAGKMSQPNYQAGISLRGFPYTEAQREVFLNVFCRTTDLLLPFCLNIINGTTSRIAQDEQQQAAANMRNHLFLDNEESIIKTLKPKVLNLQEALPIAEVFHEVFQHVQTKLDEIALTDWQAANSRQKQIESQRANLSAVTAHSKIEDSTPVTNHDDERTHLIQPKSEEECCLLF